MANPDRTALVLGATGGLGGELARQLCAAGWAVRTLKRGLPAEPQLRDGIAWYGGDALNAADVARAARGCAVIVHAVNPPGYRHWAELVPAMADHTVAAAIAERATIVLPGNVYSYGPDAFPLIDEDAPQHPRTHKGAVRVELERRLAAATERGARVLIVRMGDFFGPRARNNWFAQVMVRPGKPVRTVRVPGAPGVGHQWAYLPDVARTMIELLARREALAPFARFHTAGHWDADGHQMAEAIVRAVVRRGAPAPALRAFPWGLVRLASPFVPLLRELLEMRYLWQEPVQLDGRRLAAQLGHEPHTPLDAAVEATLAGLGCLPGVTETSRPTPPPAGR